MSLALEKMFNSFIYKKVPEIWEDKAYPSLKPLHSWFADFLERIEFFKLWVQNDVLPSYWISAMFFPQGFLLLLTKIHLLS